MSFTEEVVLEIDLFLAWVGSLIQLLNSIMSSWHGESWDDMIQGNYEYVEIAVTGIRQGMVF
jgi:hypothetical protein